MDRLVAALNELQQTLAAITAFKQDLYGRQLTEQLNQLKEFADAIAANKSIGNTLLAKLNELTQELTAIKTALKTDFVAIVKKAEGGA